jgi:hypothetical protein
MVVRRQLTGTPVELWTESFQMCPGNVPALHRLYCCVLYVDRNERYLGTRSECHKRCHHMTSAIKTLTTWLLFQNHLYSWGIWNSSEDIALCFCRPPHAVIATWWLSAVWLLSLFPSGYCLHCFLQPCRDSIQRPIAVPGDPMCRHHLDLRQIDFHNLVSVGHGYVHLNIGKKKHTGISH